MKLKLSYLAAFLALVLPLFGQSNQNNFNGNSGPQTGVFTNLNGSVFAGPTTTIQQAMTAAGINGLSFAYPNYTGTDNPSGTRVVLLNTPSISSQPAGAHLIDYRYGDLADSMFNPTFDGLGFNWTAREWITNWNNPIGNSGSSGALNAVSNVFQSNYQGGAQNWNQLGYTNKTNLVGQLFQQNSWSNGQVNSLESIALCYGNGDCIPANFSSIDWGGAQAGSDEGLHAEELSLSQGYCEYTGTAAAASVGATSIVFTPNGACNGTQGEGRPIYDITKATTAGTITSITGSTGLNAVVGSGTGWATSTSTTTSAAIAVPAGTTTTAAITTTGSQSVAVTTSTGYFVNAPLGITDTTSNNFEVVTITAIPDGTHITANFTKTHLTGATIAETQPGSVNILVASSAGFSTNNVLCVADPTSFEYVTATNVPDGTHITANFLQPHASGATIATGGMCGWGLVIDADTWTTAGSIGFVSVIQPLRQIMPYVASSSATAATIWLSIAGTADSYAGNGTFPGQAYHNYPMTFAAPGTNNNTNTIPVQPLAVAFSASDSAAEALYPYFKASLSNTQFNKFFPSQGVVASGSGISYNGIFNGNDNFWTMTLNTPMTKYTGHGGKLVVPLSGFYLKTGLVRFGLLADAFPDSAGISLGCPVNTSGTIDCTLSNDFNYKIFQANSNTGFDYLAHNPNTNKFELVVNQTLGFIWDNSGNFTAANGGLIANTSVTGATYKTASNCAVNSVSPAACGSAASGAVVIPTTTTTYTINTSAVAATSRILLTWLTFASNLPSAPTCVAPSTTTMPTISADRKSVV